MSSTPSTRSSTDSYKTSLKIIKLGGSLLDLPDVGERLSQFLETELHPAIVIGGGSSAELVRQWNRSGLMDSHEAHWLAIAAMTFNGQQLSRNSRQFRMAANRNEVGVILESGKTPILDALSILRRDPAFSTMPETWDVTSDSISAMIACEWKADLCLLKSVHPGSNPLEHLDLYFETAVSALDEFEWVNLRADSENRDPVRLSPKTMQDFQPQASQQIKSLGGRVV